MVSGQSDTKTHSDTVQLPEDSSTDSMGSCTRLFLASPCRTQQRSVSFGRVGVPQAPKEGVRGQAFLCDFRAELGLGLRILETPFL